MADSVFEALHPARGRSLEIDLYILLFHNVFAKEELKAKYQKVERTHRYETEAALVDGELGAIVGERLEAASVAEALLVPTVAAFDLVVVPGVYGRIILWRILDSVAVASKSVGRLRMEASSARTAWDILLLSFFNREQANLCITRKSDTTQQELSCICNRCQSPTSLKTDLLPAYCWRRFYYNRCDQSLFLFYILFNMYCYPALLGVKSSDSIWTTRKFNGKIN